MQNANGRVRAKKDAIDSTIEEKIGIAWHVDSTIGKNGLSIYCLSQQHMVKFA